MDYQYLNQDHLTGFDKYKYNSRDTGLLSLYVMHPFWDWLVQFCPNWIAPNLLTFTGFLFTVITYVMFTFMDYSFYASDIDQPDVPLLPCWSYTLAAIFIFVSYTLDGIDGKQARKTGTSSPLGELFDHGLDSYSVGLIPLAMYSIFGRGPTYSIVPIRMFFTFWNVIINFYLSHWEKYNTGVLFLPWGYDFSMWGTILTFLVTGIAGPEFWQFSLYGGITAGCMLEIVLYASALISNVPVVLINIYKSYKEKTGHMRTFNEAVRPLIPIFLFFGLTLIWVFYSPADILNKDPRTVLFLISTIFSNISSRLIVAQMSNTRCDAFNWLLVPTIFTIILAFVTKNAFIELSFTYCLCALAVIAHVHYGTCVVRQMCKHFHINCFSIKRQSD